MMYEHLRNQQQQQQQHHVRLDMKKRNPNCEKKKQSPEEERLRVVDLSGKSLETLTTHSLNLTVICKLDLSNNNLQNIPESLTARLLNVIVLDVRSNQLTSLPNSIGCLSKLKILNISGNLIEQLPITIEQCRLLEELNANFNKLTALPDTIGFELVNLKKLSVSFNKLAFLPYSLSHLTALKVLEARLNCLRSLPEDLENLINLEILDVSQNFQYLENLPYSVGLLISLTELDVSYNKIKSLPESVGCLRKIQKLRVEGNPLISPPMSVVEQGLPAVQEYLCDKMNSSDKSSKKRSWVNKLIKHRICNGNMRKVRHDDRGGFTMREYRSIDGLASPRYKGMFSPIRFLSPSRLLHRSTSAK